MSSRSILIAIPVYYCMDKVVNSLSSLLTLGKNDHLLIDVFIGINGMEIEDSSLLSGMVDELRKSNIFREVVMEKFSTNLGKGVSVNHMISKQSFSIKKQKGDGNLSSYDYYLSMDSDIVVKDPSTITKMVAVLESKKNFFGGVAANQEGQCCHLQSGYTTEKTNHGTLRYYTGNRGVAGGLLLIPSHVWHKVGGYRSFNRYGSDDGHFMLDCHNLGLKVPMAEEVIVYHPPESNQGYAQWKLRSCKGLLKPEESDGYKF